MQKSTKRLLSMLMAVALVLTLAPASILAVETKAEGTEPVVVPGQANWAAAPAGAAAIQSAIDEAKAIQAAAKTALTDGTCPACDGAVVTWEVLGGGTTGNRPAAGTHTHYYIEGDFSNTAANAILGNDLTTGDSICLLLVNANATLGGRFLFYSPAGGVTFNVMGTGTVHNTSTDVAYGLISNTGPNTINLYGGTFTSDASTLAEAIIYQTNASAVTNIWTDEVVIGHATVPTATRMNVNLNNGTINMYAGTLRNGYTTTQNQGGNVFIYGNSAAVFNMYGGTISGGAGGNGAIGTNVHCRGKFNMYGGQIIDGKAGSYQAGGQVSVGTGIVVTEAPAVIPTFNMYGGKISGGENTNGSLGRGGNINIAGSHANMDASVGYGKMLITGTALVENGKCVKGHGGNIIVARGGELEMTGGYVKGGKAVKGGNIYIPANTTVTLGGQISGGTCTGQGGNVYVDASGVVTLGDVTIFGGTAPSTASLSNNMRLYGATLKLKGDANCSGSVLMTDDDSIVVEPTFSGEFYVWQTAGVTLGGDVVNSTAAASYTGHVYNGAWQSATDTYIPVEMVPNGQGGLKYPTNGVVYNGSLRGAASAQAAVDTFVADTADEEVEVKPQYVMIDGNVNIGDAEVAIDALADITVSGTGTVKGVDRGNDAYSTCTGSIIADGVSMADSVTTGGRTYVALLDDAVANKYTFHKVEVQMKAITVNVERAGLYYKAQYKFDDAVAARVLSYGFDLGTADSFNAKRTSEDEITEENYANATLTVNSHGVFGIFKDIDEKMTVEMLQQRALIKVNAKPYLRINNRNEQGEVSDIGVEVSAANATSKSMADAMVQANTKWSALSEDNQNALKAFVEEWKTVGVWSAETLAELTNFNLTTAE